MLSLSLSLSFSFLFQIAIFLQSKARTRIWRQRFLRVKGAIDHLKRCMDDADSTPELIDQAIIAYESLKFKTNTKLIQAAIKIRNRLFEQLQAKQAVNSALKSSDLETMRTAIMVAEKALLDSDMFPPMGQLQALLKNAQEHRQKLEGAVALKDIPMLKQCMDRARELNLNGPEEKRAATLVATLEEELRVALKLAAEQKAREIEALKKAVQAAMAAKSAAMLDAALKKALADVSLDLASDPLILEAQKLISTLDKEVQVAQLAQVLKAAIDSDDLTILEQTVKLAMDKGFHNHALTIQAKESITKLHKREEFLMMLGAAVASKNEQAIQLTLANVGSAENLKTYPTLAQTAEYIAAQTALHEYAAKRAEISSNEAATKGDQEAAALESLKTAIESKNQQLLEQALAGAKAAGFTKESPGVPGERFVEASKLFTAIAAENDMRRQELLNANANVSAESKAKTRRSLLLNGQVDLLDSQLNAELSSAFSFDPAVYSRAEFELGLYADLRSVGDFAGDKKAFRTGMLKHSKDVIPRSLSKFENQARAMASVTAAAPAAPGGGGGRRGSVLAGGPGSAEWSQRVLSEQSVECFKMIQGFMLDRQYSFPDTLVTELMGEILLYPALRNEVSRAR